LLRFRTWIYLAEFKIVQQISTFVLHGAVAIEPLNK